MITQFKDYLPSQNERECPVSLVDQTIQEYLGTFRRRIFILESYWEPHIFKTKSVYPLISSLGNFITEDVVVGHRYFDSSESLLNYIKYPGGQIWNFPETYGTSVFMFEAHSSSKGMTLPLNDVSRDELIKNCSGFRQSPNILIFGGCGMFQGKDGKDFGHCLVKESGTKGVFGFSGPMLSFMVGTMVEMILLSHFLFFMDGDPFLHLTEIYENVLRDFPLARTKEVGFTLFKE